MIVVTGPGGQLGTAFRGLFADEASYLDRTELDLAEPGQGTKAIVDLAPELVINCAAYTAVDQAESEQQLAHRINGEAVGELAAAAARVGAVFVTFSTDYVFDGAASHPYVESSETAPLGVYGASKLAGEHLAMQEHPSAVVIRTSWVLSGTHENFAATMIRLVAEKELRVVDDQRGHPTLADDLAQATMAAVEARASGLVHLTNSGTVSWFELARECVELAGLEPARITPCTTDEYPRPAPRPANSVLESERLEALGLEPMPHYRTGLERAIKQLAANR